MLVCSEYNVRECSLVFVVTVAASSRVLLSAAVVIAGLVAGHPTVASAARLLVLHEL